MKNCPQFNQQLHDRSVSGFPVPKRKKENFNPLPDDKILDRSKLKQSADNNFENDENSIKFSKQVENTVGKGEIARHEQFLLFPQCFQKACFPGVSKGVTVWELVNLCNWKHLQTKNSIWLNSLLNCNILDWAESEAFADVDTTGKIEILFGKGRKLGGKRRKCW